MQAWHTTERNQHVTFAALHTEMVLVTELNRRAGICASVCMRYVCSCSGSDDNHFAVLPVFCAMATLRLADTQTLKCNTLLTCSEGSRRFDNQVSLVTGQLMSEVYDAGVLADVQQAQRIVASCLTASTFKGLLDNVSCCDHTVA